MSDSKENQHLDLRNEEALTPNSWKENTNLNM